MKTEVVIWNEVLCAMAFNYKPHCTCQLFLTLNIQIFFFRIVNEEFLRTTCYHAYVYKLFSINQPTVKIVLRNVEGHKNRFKYINIQHINCRLICNFTVHLFIVRFFSRCPPSCYM